MSTPSTKKARGESRAAGLGILWGAQDGWISMDAYGRLWTTPDNSDSRRNEQIALWDDDLASKKTGVERVRPTGFEPVTLGLGISTEIYISCLHKPSYNSDSYMGILVGIPVVTPCYQSWNQ